MPRAYIQVIHEYRYAFWEHPSLHRCAPITNPDRRVLEWIVMGSSFYQTCDDAASIYWTCVIQFMPFTQYPLHLGVFMHGLLLPPRGP